MCWRIAAGPKECEKWGARGSVTHLRGYDPMLRVRGGRDSRAAFPRAPDVMKPLGATIGLGSAKKSVLEVAAGRSPKRGLRGGM